MPSPRTKTRGGRSSPSPRTASGAPRRIRPRSAPTRAEPRRESSFEGLSQEREARLSAAKLPVRIGSTSARAPESFVRPLGGRACDVPDDEQVPRTELEARRDLLASRVRPCRVPACVDLEQDLGEAVGLRVVPNLHDR